MSVTQYNKGDQVEVTREPNDATWHSATVRRSPSDTNQIYVQYKTLTSSDSSRKRTLKEFVDVADVRPVPPLELHRRFLNGDIVDACVEKDTWRKGAVMDILEGSKYLVRVDGVGEEDFEVEQWNLRVHRDWDHGSWVPPLPGQEKAPEMVVERRPIILRFKLSKKETGDKFSQGTMVEVSSDEEGYQGSWYAAKIVSSLGNDKFLVEYLDLKSDDFAKNHTEEAFTHNIRPSPPEILRPKSFKEHEEVDAWYNNGWWAGVIYKVLDDLKYLIYFNFTDDYLEFEHSKLRPHQDWKNGEWIIPLKEHPIFVPGKETSNKSVVSEEVNLITNGNEKPEREFAKGTKVEVKSDAEGFEGSWYTAKIVGSIEKDMFLVEYLTLRSDDETEPLKEEAHASCIRPFPPNIKRDDRLRRFEKVDAWYNDGWWVGFVHQVLCNLKYTIYFPNSKEEMELHHSALRPHQEWIDGKWVLASEIY